MLVKDGVSHPHYELVLDGPVALRADLNHVRHLDQSETEPGHYGE